MLELIKNILQFLQIIILFIIPFITIYWTLVQVNLPSFIGIQAILSMIFDPIIAFLGSIYNFNTTYQGKTINMSAFVAIFILLVIFYIFTTLIKIIEFLEQKIASIEAFKKIRNEEKIQKQITDKYIEKMKENKVCFLIVEFFSTKNSISYLFEDPNENESKLPVAEIIDYAANYQGKLINKKEDTDSQNYMFVFYNNEEVLNYAFYLEKNIKNLKTEFINVGVDINFKIAIDCAINETQTGKIIKLLEKMINLAGINQIICTSLFSEKYKALGENPKIKFNHKGLYSIFDQKHELFDIKNPTSA